MRVTIFASVLALLVDIWLLYMILRMDPIMGIEFVGCGYICAYGAIFGWKDSSFIL
jgi:hypothetical protein